MEKKLKLNNAFFLSILKLMIVTLCISFACVNSANADDSVLAATNVTMNASNLKSGYIYLNIPIYDDEKNDEGISPTSSRAGRIKVNGSTLLRFWSFHDEGDGQSEADWYWVRAHRTRSDVKVLINDTYGTDNWKSITAYASSYDKDDYTQVNITKDGSTTWAQIRVCLPTSILDDENLNVEVSYYVDENAGDDYGDTSTSGNFSGLTFPTPSLSYSFSSTAGKYDISASVSNINDYSEYEYSIDGTNFTTFTSSPISIPVDITDTEQSKTVTIRYTLGYCSRTMTKTNSITLAAYPQANSFTATQLNNGNTEITWNANTENLGSSPQTGDQFEIQRADNEGFNNTINIAKVDYAASQSSYSIIDETSEENLNGTYYYRIRRTKTQGEWGWAISSTTSVNLQMSHKNIASANARLLEGNISKVTWEYDSGNVWTDGTTVILERYNVTNGGVKEVITIPEDSLPGRSYSEELYQMCNKFTYKIYVNPGSSEYTTEEAFSIQEKIVPIESGQLLSLNASKGYFSDRIEMSWETDGLSIDYFIIKSRIYQSGNSFKQIQQVTGTNGSELYQLVDEQANPGAIYEYQVIGVTNCADVTVYTDTLYTYGFRTPTGDIYGMVTFESGQAEQDVEVRLESDGSIIGKSLVFTSTEAATINDATFLKNNTDFISIQAWVAPDDLTGTRKIFSKPGMYELGIKNQYFYFSAGTDVIFSQQAVSSYLVGSDFVHISGISTGDSLFIYINGERTDSTIQTGSITGNTNQVTIGENFEGAVDEVRVWSRALSAEEVKRDYNRYITGGEDGLIAYYSFNYLTENYFYDRSYINSDYNENHGHINGASSDATRIPTNEQLGYKGVTGEDGSYSIRAVPYSGNGTVYIIIPRLGIHQFEPQQEIRFIGDGSETFTVNFTDKSSFTVTGTVTYDGGTVPVEGVSFTIDGVVAMGAKGNVLMTNAQGEFEISVPVGSHQVIARKINHVFKNDGKITDSYGVDLNYQDDVLGLELIDITKVRYIGRVAGGAEQDGYILGHSLSTNNLSDGLTVTLTTKNPAYYIASEDKTITYEHFLPSNRSGDEWPKSNSVDYGKESIIIYPNVETGEFVADVIPESYTVTVNAFGHDDIPGSGEDLNLSQNLVENTIINEYTDSILVDGEYVSEDFSDTVYYGFAQKFIKRYSPTVRISQVDDSEEVLPYFGELEYSATTLDGTVTEMELYNSDNDTYTLGYPVFKQSSYYDLKAEVFEEYIYYGTDGSPKEGVENDEVPTADATVEFTNDLAVTSSEEVEADSVGAAYYDFQVADPELISGLRSLSAKVYYGSDENQTSINWDGAFDAIILGAIQSGRDFVTGGPDKVLMVLRDPPGTNSYSYLEKGISVSESSTYNGSVKNTGSVLFTQKLGTDLITWTGVGAGTIQSVVTKNGWTLGVVHEESVSGSDSKSSVTTTTTRIQTSSNYRYVGAVADVFVGYSTNIAYGSSDNLSIISASTYDDDQSKYEIYENITPANSDWLLVKQEGLGVGQNFGTMFAYSQKHIVNILLPEMDALRNNFLMQLPSGMTIDQLQQMATDQDTTFYVSYLPASDPNYGKSNSDDDAFDEEDDPDSEDPFNGPSYRVIFPERDDYTRHDTILYLNQSISNWHKQLENNEKAKLDALLLQNYSFQGGTSVSYSESYSTTESSTVKFDIMVGANYKTDVGVDIQGQGFKLSIDEKITTSHGGSFSDSETQKHSKGFVLSESKNDYISVDVMHEDAEAIIGEYYTIEWNPETGVYDTTWVRMEDNFYPTFVFRTQAGATSCPYEGEYVTQYYEPGEHVISQATKQIEVPEIAVEEDFIENVPSGEYAYFTLYIRNKSEIDQKNWYYLKVVQESNPNGAELFIDGAPIGNNKEFVIAAGESLVKTLAVGKGSALNYDNLKLVLASQCQYTINDTVTFSVHFIPSCSNVNLAKPSDSWTYNTKLLTLTIDGVDEHYMNVRIDNFDVNYDSFNRLKLQYKSAAESDDDWKTLMNYYADSVLYDEALASGWNAEIIDPADLGVITYKLKMDDLPDQLYDMRVVSVCLINNEEIYNYSDVASGIKDMYCPRLFGSPEPADGILTIEDEIQLNFNEQIADGLLTKNNFQVRGVRNGAQTDHSVSIYLDGNNDYMATEFEKNQASKDITVEMWIKSDEAQNATLFTHGNIIESIGMALTNDNYLKTWVGGIEVVSNNTIPFEAGSWAHVAFVYSRDGYISAYYNFSEVINSVYVGPYNGIGNFVLGSDITSSENFFNGYMHNVRVWNEERTSGELQTNSLSKLSGNEPGLLAYYPMTEARGDYAEDNARGANMLMNGCIWTTPEGRSVYLNGSESYVKINTGSSTVITDDMDYTIEFWFKGVPGQTNATLFSNGRGDGLDMGGSEDLFSIGFDGSGRLFFSNNGYSETVNGDYLDNDWHHLAINVGRTIGRGQIYIDGELINYFSVDELGGVASAYMYIGARGWYEEGASATLTIDNYFEGQVDEVRIWNLYKYEQQIQDYNNVKLAGTEMGLLAYYPFEYYKEWQGVEELDFTLADMKVQSDEAISVPDASGINFEEVSDIPPVKDKGPVSDLEFDFVVNDDALIIYLEETPEKVEKTIVTFTVDGVQDINGNENISPITWSAYIDRNMLKWGETSLTLTKPLDELFTFTVKAVNKGGAIEHYIIQNTPSWMYVSPTSGTIDPNSSIDVTFEIDEGLNVGSYNENIYLTNSDNVSEVLDVNVTVKGETPDWNVNPADYEYNMQISAKLRINNLFSNDPEDMIAAFVEEKCIGVANVHYEEKNDMWYAFLIMYSNEKEKHEDPDDIVFKIWDASTGTVYYADPGEQIYFENNSIVGSPASPKIFDAENMIYQYIDLEPGWNWFSFNLDAPAMYDLNEFLAYMNWDAGNFFKSEVDNISSNYSAVLQRWISKDPISLENELMYKVSSSVTQSIHVLGSKITPSEMPIGITGKQWNYIGYLPAFRLKIDEALAGYETTGEDVIKSHDEFAVYAGNVGWVGSLTHMEPGKGYMFYREATNNTTLVYPDHEGSLSTKSASPYLETEFVNHDYSRNMNIIAVSDMEQHDGDRIFVYSGSELNAEVSLRRINSEPLYFITIPGYIGQKVWFELERNGKVIGRTTEVFNFVANTIRGSINEPYLLRFSDTEDLLTAYPNPVKDEVILSLSTCKSGRVDIRITDITGRTVFIGVGENVVNGKSLTPVDCSKFLPGMYFALVTLEDVTKVIKIEKQ